MHKTLTTFLALSLCLAAGCGGDDESSGDSAKAPAKAAKTAPAASGDVPSYEQVKAVALKDPKVAELCAGGGEDSTISAGLPAGETYTRLICDGNREILDYVAGPKAFAKNYRSSVDLSTYDLWKMGSDAYVKPGSTDGVKNLAAGVKAECGCGETVKGGYGS